MTRGWDAAAVQAVLKKQQPKAANKYHAQKVTLGG